MSTAAVAASASLPTASVTRPCRRPRTRAFRPASAAQRYAVRRGTWWASAQAAAESPAASALRQGFDLVFIDIQFSVMRSGDFRAIPATPPLVSSGAAGPAVPAIRPGGDRGRRTGAIGATSVAGWEGPVGGAAGAGLGRPGA